MKKSKKAPKVDPFLEGLMQKLLDRLVGIEKQLATLISQTKHKSNGTPETPKPHHDRTMYEAVCADCHKVCEVPFKPSEDRAVYCKECWARRKSGNKGPSLTPVVLRPKPVSKLGLPPAAPPPAAPKKTKKTAAKKSKKKK